MEEKLYNTINQVDTNIYHAGFFESYGVWIIVFLVIRYIIKFEKGQKEIKRKNEIILDCQYCNRRVKRVNLHSGQCPYCGNQVE